ncbi:hypothetical protein [Nesterenkonia natronophila]|uniref:Uncharacterized protein n=1 Tax=Nesterenkonia natronophila TaxID=2174932 RepID=A0A3A4F252_9MICC|nr:hypothetical protein [Nesterenkonia natronophila]RJN32133.1 hypothetical protein D3250_08660 [Nesterenkonia natronophila]
MFGYLAANVLACDDQTEVIELTEAVEVRTGESRLGHVEVFQMGGVVTPIFEGSPHPTAYRRARLPAPAPAGEDDVGVIEAFKPGGSAAVQRTP